MKVAVIDTSTILKFLHKSYVDKNMVVQQVWQIIEDFSKVYGMVIIPYTALVELKYATEETKRQILRNSLSRYNVIVKHYSSDDIFVFARNAAIEFHCPVDIITYDTHVGTRIKYTVEVF